MALSFAARSAGRMRLDRFLSAPSACTGPGAPRRTRTVVESTRRSRTVWAAAATAFDRDASADCEHEHDPPAGTSQKKAQAEGAGQHQCRCNEAWDRRSQDELVTGASGSVERSVVQRPKAMPARGRHEVGGEERDRPARGRVGRQHRKRGARPASPDGRDGNGQTLNRGDGRVLERAAQ